MLRKQLNARYAVILCGHHQRCVAILPLHLRLPEQEGYALNVAIFGCNYQRGCSAFMCQAELVLKEQGNALNMILLGCNHQCHISVIFL